MEIILEDGKYTYRFREGVQTVHRYGEPWRDLTGDKFVYLLAVKIDHLEAENARLWEELAASERTREGLVKFYAGAVADAARYRWLRDEDSALEVIHEAALCLPNGEELDAAIDEAMKE